MALEDKRKSYYKFEKKSQKNPSQIHAKIRRFRAEAHLDLDLKGSVTIAVTEKVVLIYMALIS